MGSLASREEARNQEVEAAYRVSIQMSSLASRETINLADYFLEVAVSIQMSSLASREFFGQRLEGKVNLSFHSNEFSSE